jgi:TRAP transporter TAXI family solute receptor
VYAASAILAMTGCQASTKASGLSIPTIRVATDGKDYNPLLQALNGPLQIHYTSRIQAFQNDLPNNVRLVEAGQTDLAIVPVNVAYLAYLQGWADLQRPYTKLRGIAALYSIPLYLIARRDSGIRNWTDIRGKRVAIGTPDSTTQVTVKMALDAFGLSFSAIDAHWVNGNAAVEELRAARVDAVFHRGNDPPATFPKLLRVPDVAVVPISVREAEQIRALHPFLHPMLIAAHAYGDHPRISTIGVDSLVVCRDDLPDQMVYAVTRAVFELLVESPNLTRGFQRVDLRRIQATPIPLHPGAARYFRERELFQ